MIKVIKQPRKKYNKKPHHYPTLHCQKIRNTWTASIGATKQWPIIHFNVPTNKFRAIHNYSFPIAAYLNNNKIIIKYLLELCMFVNVLIRFLHGVCTIGYRHKRSSITITYIDTTNRRIDITLYPTLRLFVKLSTLKSEFLFSCFSFTLKLNSVML